MQAEPAEQESSPTMHRRRTKCWLRRLYTTIRWHSWRKYSDEDRFADPRSEYFAHGRQLGLGLRLRHARAGRLTWASFGMLLLPKLLLLGFRQCGSFVEVCAVGCVLSRGRGLVQRSAAACARGPHSSTSASTSCLYCPVLPRRLWRVVGWVGMQLDVIGGGKRDVGGVLPRIHIGADV